MNCQVSWPRMEMRGCDPGQHPMEVRKTGLWRHPILLPRSEPSGPHQDHSENAAWCLALSLLPLLVLVPQGCCHGPVPFTHPSNVFVSQDWHPPLPSALLGELPHSGGSSCTHISQACYPATTPAQSSRTPPCLLLRPLHPGTPHGQA